jgi:hypothetical protein
MIQNFGRVLISSVYAKIDSPQKKIKEARVPVRSEEEYMDTKIQQKSRRIM